VPVARAALTAALAVPDRWHELPETDGMIADLGTLLTQVKTLTIPGQWALDLLRLPVGSGAGRLVEVTRRGPAFLARREGGPDARPPGDEHGRTQGDHGTLDEQGGNP